MGEEMELQLAVRRGSKVSGCRQARPSSEEGTASPARPHLPAVQTAQLPKAEHRLCKHWTRPSQ